jgi:hypothetical protein
MMSGIWKLLIQQSGKEKGRKETSHYKRPAARDKKTSEEGARSGDFCDIRPTD